MRIHKRGQLEISFGMIFSIILIIVFISFGIYGVIKLINLQNEAMMNKALNELQEDINSIWRSQIYSSENYSYSFPSNVDKVCFKDEREGNLFLYSKNSNIELKSKKIENINLARILNNQREKCFFRNKGKFVFNLEKNEGDNLVTIS
jgi:Golgi nucleoside diphosphatase